MNFVPLHIISGYSFLESGLTMDRIFSSASKKNYYGLGLTDNALYGVPEFIGTCEKLNKKYVIGLSLIVEDYHLSVFVINETGYRNLIKLNSLNQKDELNLSSIKEYTDGLVAVIDTSKGQFKNLFTTSKANEFAIELSKLSLLFKDDCYLGLEIVSRESMSYADSVRDFADKYTYKCIAFPTIRYQEKQDAIILKIVKAIESGSIIEEKQLDGMEFFWDEKDYQKVYKQNEIELTKQIVDRSTFEFHKNRGEMISYPVENPNEYLTKITNDKLKELNLGDEYQSRLNYELETIVELGYANYFLIVNDYVKWAKTNNILVGPGRGSAAGSLVSYLLNISEADPIKNNLQFERFLNKHRKTMPDIDVDFMDVKRDEVVEYLRQKYGKNKVAYISTVQTILAKQALRDIGRVYDYPSRHIDLLSKKINAKDKKITLREAYKQLPEFKELIDSDKYFLEIVSLASKIEGLPRQSGLHAAGIVLNNTDISESLPVSYDGFDNLMSQYEMTYLEKQGFLKMDFLSLRNLTVIYNCVQLINARHPESKIDMFNIPYDEPQIFESICKGNNMGIFQIETSTMAMFIKTLQPRCFNDVVALLGLDRPSSNQYLETYSRRRDGKEKIYYLFPELEPILKETYGVMLYQEQINSIVTKIAGFSLGEADLFRRAISKKDKNLILENKQKFIDGAKKFGHDENKANKLFDNILQFADYGFNKSHSYVYSMLTCRMVWLKVHYPLEFYVAALDNSTVGSDIKFANYITEMNRNKIEIQTPSVNKSSKIFEISNNALIYPLSGIKEVDDRLVSNIIYERELNGAFKDFNSFVVRMYQYKIRETQISRLIQAGALDELYSSRATMLESIKPALQYAELNYDENGQLSLGIMESLSPSLKKANDDPIENLNNEFEALGIMLSDNPMKYKRELLSKEGTISLCDINDLYSAKVAGMIKHVKLVNTKKKETMAIVTVFDETAEKEIIIFPELYKTCSDFLRKNMIIKCEIAKNRSRNDADSYAVNKIELMEDK